MSVKCAVVQGLMKQKDVCALPCIILPHAVCARVAHVKDSFHSGKEEGQPLAFLSGAFFEGG